MKSVNPTPILLGVPVRAPRRLAEFQALGFDVAEIPLDGAAARRKWWELGIVNPFQSMVLIAHGPIVGPPPGDSYYLVNAYLPELKATIDTCFKLGMGLLTIHLGLDRRAVDSFFVNRAVQVLRELVDYGSVRGVTVCLENVTEDAEDLGAVLDPVPGLGITLDVGHAQLGGDVNRSFEIIRRHGSCLRHVHLHDNNGGDHQDDLHLPIGEGVVDFSAILGALLASDYRGSMTLEVPVAGIRESKERLEGMLRRLG